MSTAASAPQHSLKASTGSAGTTVGSTGSLASQAGAPKFKGFQVPEVLTWKNPYETGVLLVEALGLFAVFGSTITLRYFLKIASSVVGLLSVAEWVSRSISGQRNGLVSTYQPSRFLPLSDRVVNDVANYASSAFRRVTFGIQHLLDARDPLKGLRLAGFLYAIYVLLGLLPLKTLVLTSIIVAFSVPPLYLQFKPEVDEAITKIQFHVHEHFKELSKKAHAKAGPQINYLKKFVGPRGGFDTTKNVSPVSEVPVAAAKKTPFNSKQATSAHTATTHSPSHTTHATTHAAPTHAASTSTSVSPTSAPTNPVTLKTTGATTVPDDVFKNFDTVPTLTGNVPIDHEKLSAALAADKAKAEGAVNGL